jgi:hypothetical protein
MSLTEQQRLLIEAANKRAAADLILDAEPMAVPLPEMLRREIDDARRNRLD